MANDPGAGTAEAAGAGPGAGRLVHGGLDRFGADNGSADPVAAAALAALAAGTGSEHAALEALARARLLVPVVAAAADEPSPGGHAPAGQAVEKGGEKASEMALPALVGADGRRALPAFTSVAALARWQPSARPVPADAARVWQAAAQDSCAVVIDVAGPVPLAVEGARLAALARGEPVPPLHADPDVAAAVAGAVGEAAAALGLPAGQAGCALRPGVDGGDLLIELAPPPAAGAAAAEALAGRVGSAVLSRLGPRLRRGIDLVIVGE